MRILRKIWKATFLTAILAGAIIAYPLKSNAGDFIVYSIYKGLDMGSSAEAPQKDFYVNMGSSHGVRDGQVLEVMRRAATYDLTNQKLYKDVMFPIAKLKVIHVESNAAIARLDAMLPAEKTPAITPRAVMVGDVIKVPD